MKSDQLRCDIFCTVIDNYGDAGTCWRLARQLAIEHDWRVRLWIDRPEILARLAPDTSPVEVLPWDDNARNPAEIVIEAFACELPQRYVATMAQRRQPPVWINLEYLSAETWVASCHGLPSPHPRLPLTKHFFFPGFAPGTGGLLREGDYQARRAVFDETAWRREFGLPPRRPEEITVSLFSYPNPALAGLLDAWANSPQRVHVLAPGSTEPLRNTGNVWWHPLPFLPQLRYDELLWASDLNFVRGEDSFVRAQWAGKPFVWHIYAQSENAHLVKLDAFLDRYAKVGSEAGVSRSTAPRLPNGPASGRHSTSEADGTALRAFWRAWNGNGKPDWQAFSTALPRLAANATSWAEQLASHGDLATNLVQFCLARLK